MKTGCIMFSKEILQLGEVGNWGAIGGLVGICKVLGGNTYCTLNRTCRGIACRKSEEPLSQGFPWNIFDNIIEVAFSYSSEALKQYLQFKNFDIPSFFAQVVSGVEHAVTLVGHSVFLVLTRPGSVLHWALVQLYTGHINWPDNSRDR